MKEFEDLFSFDSILNQLCRHRAKLAFFIHKNSYLDQFCNTSFDLEKTSKYEELKFLQTILPPRKSWSRPNSHEYRKKLETAIEINKQSIKNAVYKVHRRFISKEIEFLDTPKWYQNLRKFMFELRILIFQNPSLSLSKPDIIPLPKEKGKPKMRPIANFKIPEKIILSITNKYLNKIFNSILLPCSTAFRHRIGTKFSPKHHDTVAILKNFRNKNIGIPLYVSECDIQKFFDCVDHNIAANSYQTLYGILEESGRMIDPVANKIFSAFLNCYSFNDDVFAKNFDKEYWQANGKLNGEFEWTEANKEKFHSGDLKGRKIGIPQGGALSGLIVNLIMHNVDKTIYDEKTWNSEMLYLRYCDDMVIIHKSSETCSRLFELYKVKLAGCGLDYHAPHELKKRYHKSFWGEKVKSRNIYCWHRYSLSAIPQSKWVSFLGYMVHYDGDLKIRKKSLDKQIEKHRNEVFKVFRKLDLLNIDELSKYKNSIIFSFESKLCSMAVGKVDIGAYKTLGLKMCWGEGFKLLENNKFIRKQLKELDKSRKRAVAMLKYYFISRKVPENIVVIEGNIELPKKPAVIEPRYPHSFYSLLDRPRIN